MDKYILQEGDVIYEPDLIKWAQWFETADRNIALTHIGDAVVSTVFLGVDHSFYFVFENGRPHNPHPILFETMIFGGEQNGYQERYHTLEDAMLGHEKAKILARPRTLRGIAAYWKAAILRRMGF